MNLTLARKTVSTLAMVATIALLVAAFTPAQAQAGSFSCQQASTCPNQASCDGTYYTRDACTVRCFIPAEGGTTGEIVPAGSATCSAPGGGGGGDDDLPDDWWCGTYCW